MVFISVLNSALGLEDGGNAARGDPFRDANTKLELNKVLHETSVSNPATLFTEDQ